MKNKLKHFTTLLITLTIITSTGLALQGGQPTTVNQATSNNSNFGDVNIQEDTSIIPNFQFLSALQAPEQANPGETILLDFTLDVNSNLDDGDGLPNGVDSSEALYIVEIYECVDSGCEDPEQDEFIEAVRVNPEVNRIGPDILSASSYSSEINYDIPSDASGPYGATAYLWVPKFSDDGVDNDLDNRVDEADDPLISDRPETVFQVGTTQEPTTDVDVEYTRTPYFDVNDEANSIQGSLTLKNFGQDAMPESHIVEMQVREGDISRTDLSFTGSQDACDESYPNNVHDDFQLDSGESEDFDLVADNDLEDGQTYSVFFFTRSECFSEGDGVEPIPTTLKAGTVTFDEEDDGGTTDPGDPSDPEDPEEPEAPSVEKVSKPQLSYENGQVKTRVSFKNTGGGMSESHIVEMQVRPKGERPLAFSSTQQVCDTEYPNNVHKEFNLDGGESASTTLSTSVSEAGEYDVFLLTRDQCAPGNERVDPYPNSVKAGTVSVGGEFGGFVEVVEDNPLVSLLFVGGVLVVAVGIGVRYL